MDELLQRLIANNFAELEGLQVTGSLPVRQDIINDALTTLLQNAQARSASQSATVPPAADSQPFSPAAPAPKPVAPATNWFQLVSKLQVQLQDGKAVVAFELRR